MDEDGYCHICHQSDMRGVKHIYNKKHKERVRTNLRKFEVKVQTALEYITSGPTVVQYEPSHSDDKFWCPFCVIEVIKHERHVECTVMFKSWAEHLCSLDHHKKVHQFFWANKLDMKKRDRYKLSQEKMDVIKSLATKKLERYREISTKVIKLEAEHIRAVERQRALTPSQDKASAEIVPTHNALAADPETGRKTHSESGIRESANSGGHAVYPGGEYGLLSNQYTSQPTDSRIFRQSEESKTWHPIMESANNSGLNMTQNDSSVCGLSRSESMGHMAGLSVGTLMGHMNSGPHVTTSQIGTATSNSSVALLSQRDQATVSSHRPGPSRNGNTGTLMAGEPGPSGLSRDPLLPGGGPIRTTKVVSSGGLTVISRKIARLKGNVHTGAVPPWMIDESKEGPSSGEAIGPTEEDFKKHLESERKRKLNPKRVGANFDHEADTPAEWLPSFGRVWNHGPRWRSRKQYRKEADSKLKKSR